MLVGVGLVFATLAIWPAGRISLLVTDTVQGMLSYPIFVIVAGYIFFHFNWGTAMEPVMLDRVPGESFLDPFDVAKLRDFNLFALGVTLMNTILQRASWFGSGFSLFGLVLQRTWSAHAIPWLARHGWEEGVFRFFADLSRHFYPIVDRSFQLGIFFVAVLLWNLRSPWPKAWWGKYYYVTSLIVPMIVGCVSTVWFVWGGIRDGRRLFRDLAARAADADDNARRAKPVREAWERYARLVAARASST